MADRRARLGHWSRYGSALDPQGEVECSDEPDFVDALFIRHRRAISRRATAMPNLPQPRQPTLHRHDVARPAPDFRDTELYPRGGARLITDVRSCKGRIHTTLLEETTMTAPTILLVEDNDDDAYLTIRAFKEAQVSNPIVRVADGIEALDYLFGRGTHSSRDITELPAVMLLDLNLPRLDGLEVLAAVRKDARTKHLPVVVLTSSTEDRDRFAAYDHHANSYVQKPVDYEQFVPATRQLGLYWMVLNVGPGAKRG